MQRKDDGRERQGRVRGARHEHHGQGADEHDEVVQHLAQCRARRRLDLRSVGREPAHDLARMRGLVEVSDISTCEIDIAA
jgi:hypothetical protein